MNRTFAARLDGWDLGGAAAAGALNEPFDIGTVTVANRVVQPPLAGIANWAYRAQSRRHGVGLAVSEMVSAYGIVYDNQRTRDMLDTAHDEGPVGIQLFGADPVVMAAAAKVVAAAGADLIDVNMGCPVRKVCKTGAGAALLTDPDVGARVVAAMVAAVDVPVTVKMRRGMTPATADPIGAARRFVDAGAQAIFYHPRTASEEYDGRADHAHTAELVAAVGVPVIASGDIDTPAEALRLVTEVGAAAVAVGRPAFGNPWLFAEILTGERRSPAALGPIVDEVARFAADVRIALGEHRACAYMRKFYPWYLAGSAVSAVARERLLTTPTLDGALALLREIATHDALQPHASVDYLTAPSPA